jgi:hypothetical protein
VFRALRGLSSVYGNRGETAEAVATIRRAVAVPDAPVDEGARLTCFVAQLELTIGAIDADEALACGSDGLARAVERADLTGQCVAHQVLGAIYSFTGFGDLALQHSIDAMSLFDSGKVRPTSYLIPDMFYALEAGPFRPTRRGDRTWSINSCSVRTAGPVGAGADVVRDHERRALLRRPVR